MKKKTKAKPDFMDADRDGNRTEPMRKAMKTDSGRKASVKGRPTMKVTKMPKRKTK